MNNIKYSVLIPLKDEEGNIRELIAELEPVMQSLEEPWELLCIDDGSSDETPAILRELAATK
ncbi:MAG: glycosyltransferase, partial [Nitrosomonas sp.]